MPMSAEHRCAAALGLPLRACENGSRGERRDSAVRSRSRRISESTSQMMSATVVCGANTQRNRPPQDKASSRSVTSITSTCRLVSTRMAQGLFKV